MPVTRRSLPTPHHDPGVVSQKNSDMGSGSPAWARTVVRGERLVARPAASGRGCRGLAFSV